MAKKARAGDFTFVKSFLWNNILTCNKSQENKKSTDYFPNPAGSYWEYDVYDSSLVREHSTYPRNYIVKVSIIANTTLVDGKDAIFNDCFFVYNI